MGIKHAKMVITSLRENPQGLNKTRLVKDANCDSKTINEVLDFLYINDLITIKYIKNKRYYLINNFDIVQDILSNKKIAKTLYKQIMEAIKEWNKKQDHKPHVQFIMGTLDRVKFDFYHQCYGTVYTSQTMIEFLKGSNVDFGEDGSVIIHKKDINRK